MKKLRKMIPLLVPLFLTSLRRAQELAEAMESRCYAGGKGRTYLKSPRLNTADFTALGIALCGASGAILLGVLGADGALWDWIGTHTL